jgi:L-arabinose isomerase
VPEIANVLRRLDIPFHQITGVLESHDACWEELDAWLRAAEVVHALQHGRLGLMEHYYSGMLDIATDLTQISGRFGLYIEMLEVDELSALRRDIADIDLKKKLAAFGDFFHVGDDCTAEELKRTARTSVALDRFVATKQLDLLISIRNYQCPWHDRTRPRQSPAIGRQPHQKQRTHKRDELHYVCCACRWQNVP